MGLAFKCDNLTCGKIMIYGKDLCFIIQIEENKREHRCLDCIVLMRNNHDKSNHDWYDVNNIEIDNRRTNL